MVVNHKIIAATQQIKLEASARSDESVLAQHSAVETPQRAQPRQPPAVGTTAGGGYDGIRWAQRQEVGGGHDPGWARCNSVTLEQH